MIGMLCVYAVFHVESFLPMWSLVGKAHKLGDQNWSCRSTNRLSIIVDNNLNEIVESPDNFLDHDFMMKIFGELRNGVTPFDEYLSYMFKYKQTPTMDKEDKLVPLDQLVVELFFFTERRK